MRTGFHRKWRTNGRFYAARAAKNTRNSLNLQDFFYKMPHFVLFLRNIGLFEHIYSTHTKIISCARVESVLNYRICEQSFLRQTRRKHSESNRNGTVKPLSLRTSIASRSQQTAWNSAPHAKPRHRYTLRANAEIFSLSCGATMPQSFSFPLPMASATWSSISARTERGGPPFSARRDKLQPGSRTGNRMA